MATLYNHKELGTAEKPIIENLVFKNLCDALRSGKLDAWKEVVEKYSLMPIHKRLIRELYNEAKNKS